MSSESDAVGRVIAAFEQSNWTEIDVRVGSVRVHLRSSDATDAQSVPAATNDVPMAPEAPGVSPAMVDHATEIAAVDGVIVRSPSPGIFWRSPQPGAPPFADMGQAVDATSTLCIVEVMKLMHHVKAAVSGTVVAVFGRDGVAVDKDEPLFAIAATEA
jgi:acetyl-CoA carboxylase biotin carboxyl carrier protein